MDKKVAVTYTRLIQFGRLLKDHSTACDIAKEKPDIVLNFIEMIDKSLQWTDVDTFFQIFPPIKNHWDDGTWCFKSTLEMRNKEFGTHFGKNDFKKLLMTRCYENKYLALVGLSYMLAISSAYTNATGKNMLLEFMKNT